MPKSSKRHTGNRSKVDRHQEKPLAEAVKTVMGFQKAKNSKEAYGIFEPRAARDCARMRRKYPPPRLREGRG